MDLITLVEDLVCDTPLVLNEIVDCPMQEGCNAPNLVAEMSIKYDRIVRIDGRRSLFHQICNNRMIIQRFQSQCHAIGSRTDLDGNPLSLHSFLLFVTLDDSSP